jgi:hypothetical protein
MRGGYESLTWINDKDGKEYVCYSDDVKENASFEELSEESKNNCDNVNQLVGTERW